MRAACERAVYRALLYTLAVEVVWAVIVIVRHLS
jgi:hypothetical protein